MNFETKPQKLTDFLVPYAQKIAREMGYDEVDFCEDKIVLRKEGERVTLKIIVESGIKIVKS